MIFAVSSHANTAGWPSLALIVPSSRPDENIAENISKCFNASAKSVDLLWLVQDFKCYTMGRLCYKHMKIVLNLHTLLIAYIIYSIIILWEMYAVMSHKIKTSQKISIHK